MWDPLLKWVSRTYPEDAAVMYYKYPEEANFASETPRSLELWRQHVKEYVEAQAGG